MSEYVAGEMYRKGWDDRMAGTDKIHTMYGYGVPQCVRDEYRSGWMDANAKILADARKSVQGLHAENTNGTTRSLLTD